MPVGDDVAAETAASVDVWPASELPRSDERERVWTIHPKKQQIIDSFKSFDNEEEY